MVLVASTRTSVTVTIDAAPQVQQSLAQYLQWTNGYAYPSAPSGVTSNWYDAASNGNLLFSGSTVYNTNTK
ncbi:MAG: hypothetical protein IPN93_17715 [Bacteroidetes bacterium]|nr:hypothetical protein [Bacteroidota bacterium]